MNRIKKYVWITILVVLCLGLLLFNNKPKIIWSSEFDSLNWLNEWDPPDYGMFGLNNVEIVQDPSGVFKSVLRVHYPKGSATPSLSEKENSPLGGVQFYSKLSEAKDSLHLRYYARFADNFLFVKGGKLPGLFGGKFVSGGKIPDGTNGFSTRLMWGHGGLGSIYAYLPTSVDFGTEIGYDNWKFKRGQWYSIEQKIKLNTPGKQNGVIQVWIDEELVVDEEHIVFRTVEDLKIEGIFFSTFFGGGDLSSSTPRDTYIDFANFAVSEDYIGAGEM